MVRQFFLQFCIIYQSQVTYQYPKSLGVLENRFLQIRSFYHLSFQTLSPYLSFSVHSFVHSSYLPIDHTTQRCFYLITFLLYFLGSIICCHVIQYPQTLLAFSSRITPEKFILQNYLISQPEYVYERWIHCVIFSV